MIIIIDIIYLYVLGPARLVLRARESWPDDEGSGVPVCQKVAEQLLKGAREHSDRPQLAERKHIYIYIYIYI